MLVNNKQIMFFCNFYKKLIETVEKEEVLHFERK